MNTSVLAVRRTPPWHITSSHHHAYLVPDCRTCPNSCEGWESTLASSTWDWATKHVPRYHIVPPYSECRSSQPVQDHLPRKVGILIWYFQNTPCLYELRRRPGALQNTRGFHGCLQWVAQRCYQRKTCCTCPQRWVNDDKRTWQCNVSALRLWGHYLPTVTAVLLPRSSVGAVGWM